MELKTRILVCLGITILAISLFFVPVDVKGLTYTPAAISLDKSEYSVGEQPFVTVEDTYSDFDPNAIDSIVVVVAAKPTQSVVVPAKAVEIQETGPDTRIFSGVLPAISAEDMYNDLAQVENKWLEVSYISGSTKNAAYATLIQPPTQPEPEPELPTRPSQPQTSEYIPGSNPRDCPLSFGDYYLNTEYYDFGKINTIDCGYVNDISSVEKSHFAGFVVHYVAKGYDPKPLSGDECMQRDDNWVISSSSQVLVLDLTADGYGVSEVKTAAKQFFNQLLSANVAASCTDSQADSSGSSEPKTQPTQPESSTDSDTKDSRCPEGTVYVEKFDSCATIPTFPDANPTSPPKMSDETQEQSEYDSWIKEGSENLKNGNFDEAIRYFDLAYKQNPNDQNLINLKAEALKKKGIALMDDGKFDLAVVYLGESNHLKPDEFVKKIQDNAYNRWYKETKENLVTFNPAFSDNWNLLGIEEYPPLPLVGYVDADEKTGAVKLSLAGPDASMVKGTPLNVGDVILVGENPVTLDWGYAQTTLAPRSVFLIGNPEDLQSFARGNPHYIELIDGQLKLYEYLRETSEEKPTFLLKVEKNPILVSGTDVTISYDKMSGVSSIQIDEGTIKVFDVTTNEIKEFGAGNKLVTNNDGYYLVEQAAAQASGDAETPKNGSGCLIATATFGSELAPQVQELRELRDRTLLQTNSGSAFMTGFNTFYYSFSPTISDLERQNPAFKETVKAAITPLISSLSLLQYADIDSEEEMLGYGISIILLNVGIYFVAPTLAIVKVGKLFKK